MGLFNHSGYIANILLQKLKMCQQVLMVLKTRSRELLLFRYGPFRFAHEKAFNCSDFVSRLYLGA